VVGFVRLGYERTGRWEGEGRLNREIKGMYKLDGLSRGKESESNYVLGTTERRSEMKSELSSWKRRV
jgi:hypothetical protein